MSLEEEIKEYTEKFVSDFKDKTKLTFKLPKIEIVNTNEYRGKNKPFLYVPSNEKIRVNKDFVKQFQTVSLMTGSEGYSAFLNTLYTPYIDKEDAFFEPVFYLSKSIVEHYINKTLSKIDHNLIVFDEETRGKILFASLAYSWLYGREKRKVREGLISYLERFKNYYLDKKKNNEIRDNYIRTLEAVKEYVDKILEELESNGELIDFSKIGIPTRYLKKNLNKILTQGEKAESKINFEFNVPLKELKNFNRQFGDLTFEKIGEYINIITEELKCNYVKIKRRNY